MKIGGNSLACLDITVLLVVTMSTKNLMCELPTLQNVRKLNTVFPKTLKYSKLDTAAIDQLLHNDIGLGV